MEINHFKGGGLGYDTEKCDTVIERIFRDRNQEVMVLNIVQVTDNELLAMNQKHLKHDYYTDIMTFRTDEDSCIELGELYISYERATENNGLDRESEILRLIFHGCLHLSGMNDSTTKERALMRVEENKYLAFHVER